MASPSRPSPTSIAAQPSSRPIPIAVAVMPYVSTAQSLDHLATACRALASGRAGSDPAAGDWGTLRGAAAQMPGVLDGSQWVAQISTAEPVPYDCYLVPSGVPTIEPRLVHGATEVITGLLAGVGAARLEYRRCSFEFGASADPSLLASAIPLLTADSTRLPAHYRERFLALAHAEAAVCVQEFTGRASIDHLMSCATAADTGREAFMVRGRRAVDPPRDASASRPELVGRFCGLAEAEQELARTEARLARRYGLVLAHHTLALAS